MDRFVPIEVPQPSVDEILIFMGRVANAEMPGWVRELVEKYIDAITLRKAEQAAKYIATSLRKGRSEEAVRVRVEDMLRRVTKYVGGVRGHGDGGLGLGVSQDEGVHE